MTFAVIDGLAAPAIIGTAYSRKETDSIFPKETLVEIELS